MNKWVYVHFPHLLLDYQLALQPPELTDAPQILVTSQQGQRLVHQATAAALEQGVRLQMTEVLASSLVTHLQIRDYHEQQEQRVLQQLAQLVYQDVAQLVLIPPQGLLCEVASLVRLHGGYPNLISYLQQRLQQWPLRYQLSCGYSPLSARLLAQAQQGVINENPAVIQQTLAELPITACGFTPSQQQRLQEVGMQRLGQLMQVPRAELGRRFGKALVLYMAELQGELPSPQHYYQPPLSFQQYLDLLTEIPSWPQLLFPLKRLLQQAEAFLQGHQQSTRMLLIKAHHRHGQPTQVRVSFAHPVWQQQDLLQLSQLHLERQQLVQPVLGLTVVIQQTEPRVASNQALLTETKQSETNIDSLVSLLQARLGTDKVHRITLHQHWLPEQRGQLQAWQRAQAVQAAGQHSSLRVKRPLWLLPEPQPIQVQDWDLHWGPEHLATGWWLSEPVQRDYFIGVDKNQRQAWLFKDQQGWYLHGWFS